MTAATVPPEVAEYLEAVRESLRDLPSAERDDLLVEVEASLTEAASEGGAISARLGPPEEFAAELRAAAGLHQPAPGAREDSATLRRLRALAQRVRDDSRWRTLAGLARDLAPIWWVARAYIAVGLVALAIDATWSTRYFLLPHIENAIGGILAILAAVVVSVWLGLRGRRKGVPFPRAAVALNLALALAFLPVAGQLTNRSAYDALVSMAYTPPLQPTSSVGLWNNGSRVENIYPFTRDGKLLHDVLLYDGAGVPLEVPSTRALDPNRRFVVTNGNKPLFNVFPIRYYEPGTRRVERPNAKPYIELPMVLTPPLPTKRESR